MSAMPAAKRAKLVGNSRPRIAPPTPARSSVKDFENTVSGIEMSLFPWQQTVGRYLYALGQRDRWLYPEVAVIVARQQGKTEILVPHILRRMEMGRRVLHAAQRLPLPRESFKKLAVIVERRYPKAVVRYAGGQESIEIPSTGGVYRIVAGTGGAPRGWSADDLIVDEVREMDVDFIEGAEPTVSASMNPQVLYLSNAGSEDSKALNAIRERSQGDPSLAWLEWSAGPELAADDIAGWQQANPSIGHLPGVLPSLERAYQSHKLAGTLAAFETERLCRWVATMRERLVDDFSWIRCQAEPQPAQKPYLAVSMDPRGRRVSAALAWQDGEDVRLTLVMNVVGDPVDTDAIGHEVKRLAQLHKVRGIGYDPLTDAELVKYVKLPKPEPISGQKFANASAQFRNGVDAVRIRWHDADPVTDDLTWTSMKPNGEGAYHAVRALDDRPITASLAAIRAVWLASGPPTPTARVWT